MQFTPHSEKQAIPGHPGYFCDKSGHVFSDKSGEMRLMRQRIARTGYATVALSMGRKRSYKYALVHRLVLAAWQGESDLQCNHKNGDRKDNRLENLEWLTRTENERHARKVLGKLLHGEHHPLAKVTPEDVREIRKLKSTGWTYAKLSERFGIGMSQLSRIVHRKKWPHIE